MAREEAKKGTAGVEGGLWIKREGLVVRSLMCSVRLGGLIPVSVLQRTPVPRRGDHNSNRNTYCKPRNCKRTCASAGSPITSCTMRTRCPTVESTCSSTDSYHNIRVLWCCVV